MQAFERRLGALGVLRILIGARERRWAARLVMIWLGPRPRRLVMVHAAALRVHDVQAEVLGLALRVVRVDEQRTTHMHGAICAIGKLQYKTE